MTDRIRWGILATGGIATTITEDLLLLPEEAEVLAVGSRTLERAQEFATAHGIERAYGSYAELAADPDIDVIYVATPHNDHLASTELCLRAGKAVLCEKPLTVNAEEAERLVALAREQGVLLMEAYWTRTHPLVRKVAALLADGAIGQVRHVSAELAFSFDVDDDHRLLNPDLAGGAILDLGVYPVHIAHLVLGEPQRVIGTGRLARTGVDAEATALLLHEEATAVVHCSMDAAGANDLHVYGARGRLHLPHFLKSEKLIMHRDGADPEEFIQQLPGHGYTLQAQEVMRCLRAGETESPLVPLDTTLATMRTLDAWRATLTNGS
ncbi:Gfo/Idh/MocA family protein [Propionibacteriaceae bacterium Y1700]|uniref:Gfo/Idh/MocA family protein n=1 Tax=Microlunatus sp. Y1700 TaxID=3418487 RepID=UPI003DA738D7